MWCLAGLPWLLLLLPLAEAEDPASVFRGEVEVRRIVTEVRVLDWSNTPVLGLTREDFSVELGGVPAEVESVEWIRTAPPELAADAMQRADPDQALPATRQNRGRLIVILVQTDLESVRLTGLYRTADYAVELIQRLGPDDRVALAVYSSHLDLISDFTGDFDAITRVLNVPDLLEHRPEVIPAADVSLARHFDHAAAADAARPSDGLRILGEALQPIPGPKTVIMLGWGLGTNTKHGVVLGGAFHRAVAALTMAETSVFVLDVTDADYHSLEAGLKSVAESTGGRYHRTRKHPGVAFNLVLRALQGHYELVLIPDPTVITNRIHLKVEVDRPRLEVLARPYLSGEAESCILD
jgi:VWFA-related protein